jgi:cytochrome c6
MLSIRKLCVNLLLFLITNLFIEDANAKSFEHGEHLFIRNCNVCHVGGNNLIIPEKNLKQNTLETNGMNSIDAVVYQVTNGKNGMPAFGGRLEEEEIEEIAFYVLEAASKADF